MAAGGADLWFGSGGGPEIVGGAGGVAASALHPSPLPGIGAAVLSPDHPECVGADAAAAIATCGDQRLRPEGVPSGTGFFPLPVLG